MGYSSFRIDLNYAFLMYYQLLKGNDAKALPSESHSDIKIDNQDQEQPEDT